MERVSEALQFPVVIKCSRAFSFEPEILQELLFLCRGSPAEGTILEEFFEPRLYLWSVRSPFHKLKSLGLPRRY